MSADERTPQISFPAVAAALWLAAGWVTASMTVLTVLESADLAGSFLSRNWWQAVVELLGGEVKLQGQSLSLGEVPFWSVAMAVGGVMLAGWIGSAWLARILCQQPIRSLLIAAGTSTGRWECVLGAWFVAWLTAFSFGGERTVAFLGATVDLWCAAALAGWTTAVCGLCWPSGGRVRGEADGPENAGPGLPDGQTRPPTLGILSGALSNRSASRCSLWCVLAGIGLYTVVYTVMNWQMYRGLLVPHGDSAMYEEHLWNVLHGKGFRSYLDQGLFLGEHMQVIHLALIPLYVLWPSHLLLELCESFALALTALPVYWTARRHTHSGRAAMWMALATLQYFPLHYLDIAIDFKTFRPISFGVPLLMFAIDQMERRRFGTMTLLFVATLTAKEDFAIVIAPLGLWLAVSAWRLDAGPARRRTIVFGTATALLATLYLFLAVKVFIPWFREGDTVHYARYFSRFGETPTEIVSNMLTQPGLLLGELFTAGTLVYALRLLVPLGGTPLLSPTRLLVGVPLFVLLCLNEIAQQTPAPVHHFHAPLVPIILWAAAAGLPHVARITRRDNVRLLSAARFACFCALFTGAVISFHPLSIQFWDSGRETYWRRLFVPGERARQFAKIESLIPLDARVASTDFVHPRYTHHERSYDYSDYLRKVAGYEQRVPDDTDYIVIDTQHRYSTIRQPADVRELREHPEDWELLPDETDGYFIVLRRKVR